MNPVAKRPYVRPRIGQSALRSLGYVAAITGVLIVAFFLPHSQPPVGGLNGLWDVEVSGHAGTLPDGPAQLLIHNSTYVLFMSGPPPAGEMVEFGSLNQSDSSLRMHPLRALHVDGEGRASRADVGVRTYSVTFEEGRLILSGPGELRIQGIPAAPPAFP